MNAMQILVFLFKIAPTPPIFVNNYIFHSNDIWCHNDNTAVPALSRDIMSDDEYMCDSDEDYDLEYRWI